MEYLFLGLLAYLCGSIPFGKIIGNYRGIDIQNRGSGNIGFANVQRVLGWRAGLATLGGDILKGVVPTLLALRLVGAPADFWIGVIAIVGHIFPVWLGFRGGKGIATGLGVVIIIQPAAAALGGAIYVVGRVVIKSSALSSILGILGVLGLGYYLQASDWWKYVLLLAIALWTLRHNIRGAVPKYDV